MDIPRYSRLGDRLRATFGERVYRVGLCGEFTCPNRDGSLGTEGCLFCNPASSEPLRALPGAPVADKLAAGIAQIRRRYGARKYIAYFQDYTATYADASHLAGLYREALAHPDVVGLAVSTRPDCLPPVVLDLLAEIARERLVWVELGIQSAHDRTLAAVGRGHDVAAVRSAVAALHAHGLAVVGHVILGLPGETADDMMGTADFMAGLAVAGAKIHNLHVVEDTPLADLYRRGACVPLAREEYVDLCVRFLERLPAKMAIHRLAADAPPRLTVAPDWSTNRLAVVHAIEQELERRDTWQGRVLGEPRPAPDQAARA